MRRYIPIQQRYHRAKRELCIQNRTHGFEVRINGTWPFFHFTKWEIWGHFDQRGTTYEGGLERILRESRVRAL